MKIKLRTITRPTMPDTGADALISNTLSPTLPGHNRTTRIPPYTEAIARYRNATRDKTPKTNACQTHTLLPGDTHGKGIPSNITRTHMPHAKYTPPFYASPQESLCHSKDVVIKTLRLHMKFFHIQKKTKTCCNKAHQNKYRIPTNLPIRTSNDPHILTNPN